jgi:hypothetical protein
VTTATFKLTPMRIKTSSPPISYYVDPGSAFGRIEIKQDGILHIDINLTGNTLNTPYLDTNTANEASFAVYLNGGSPLIWSWMKSAGTNKYSFNLRLYPGVYDISLKQNSMMGVGATEYWLYQSSGNIFISFKPTVSIVNHKAYNAPVHVKTDNKSYSLSGKVINARCGMYIKNGRIKFNP